MAATEKLRSVTVLVVARDADTRLYLRRCLEQLNVSRLDVREAGTPDAAMGAIEDAAFQVVIVQWAGHRESRTSLLAQLREQPGTREAAVLLLASDRAALTKAAEAVRDDPRAAVLAEPFNATSIRKVLGGLVRGL